MSKVVLYIAASLDGFIADKDGGVSWLDPYNDVDYGYDEFISGIGAIIMGATTYEQSLSFGKWFYGDTQTFVLTHRDMPMFPGANIEYTQDDVSTLVVKAQKACGDKDIWLVGGSHVLTSFLNEGAVDEMMIYIIPTLLNEGIPLFDGITAKTQLELLQTTPYSNGMVLLHYGVGYL